MSTRPKYCKKLKQISDEPPPNILYIKRVEVLAPYRGKKFGESLISNSIYMMGRKDDLVILQSVPLQLREIKRPQLQSREDTWKQEMGFPNFPSDEETAKKKLSNYYKKLGFKKLTKDGLVFLNLQHSLKG
jgi:predicted GNAT family N-acyltransferase